LEELGMRLTTWQATTFLVGEFRPAEADNHPVFTVADGLIWLQPSIDRNSMVRKMQVMQMRDLAPIPGLHTFRISDGGVHVFRRLILEPDSEPAEAKPTARQSLGVSGLDEMMGGGIRPAIQC
jgi:circadian clock protein KaiC